MALNHGFLGHTELGQCRKCNYSLKRIQNFRLFIFVEQAVLNQYAWRRSVLSECFSSFRMLSIDEQGSLGQLVTLITMGRLTTANYYYHD